MGRAGERLVVSNEFSGDLSIIDAARGAVIATVPVGKRPRGLALSSADGRAYVALTGSPVTPPGTDPATLPPPDRTADGIGRVGIDLPALESVVRGVPDPEQLAVGRSGRIYAGSELEQSLLVLDPAGRPLRRVRLGDEPEGVAVSGDERWACVTLEDEATLVVIRLPEGRELRRIPVGARPRSVVFSPRGERVYVSNEVGASVSVIDAQAWRKLRDVAVPGDGARPMGLAVAPDGGTLYVTTGRGGRVVAFDTVDFGVRASIEVGGRPWGVAVSGDGSRIYTANGPANDVAVIDARSLTLESRIAVGERPWGVLVVPGRADQDPARLAK